jgi:dipeptidyl aminopeptidase/acylaminoacyl peptidase
MARTWLCVALALVACGPAPSNPPDGGGGGSGGGGGGTSGPTVREITFDSGARGAHPRFSPDSSKLAYLREQNNAYAVAVISASGAGSATLATDASYLTGFAWKPDGSEILYTGSKIRWVPVAGGATRDVISGFAALDPDVSPDGKLLVYGVNGSNLKLVDLTVTPAVETDLGVKGSSPRFSPDGARIAFNGEQHLKWMVVATKQVTDVLDLKDFFGSVDWFKDGNRLVVGSDQGIELVTLSTPPVRSVVKSTFAQLAVDLSPDEKSIAYTENGQASIFVLTGF